MATGGEKIYEWDRNPRMPLPAPPRGSCDWHRRTLGSKPRSSEFVDWKSTAPSVTPVKTGVHPHPLNLDTVFQRYDRRCPPPPHLDAGFRRYDG